MDKQPIPGNKIPRATVGAAAGTGIRGFAGFPAWFAPLLLVVAVTLLWCVGTGIHGMADLRMPTVYLDQEKGDVMDQLAHIRAARDGNFLPVVRKEVPEVGAPFGSNWSDWPLIEEMQFLVMGWLAHPFGLFGSLNVTMLLGHVLAALCFYLVARHERVAPLWAFAGGLAFGMAPVIFSQSPHHTTVQLCWHLPLFLPVISVIGSEDGLGFGSRRFWYCIAVATLTGLKNPYFTFLFCQLVMIAALIAQWRRPSVPRFASALAVLAVAVLAFAVMNLDTWVFRLEQGPNPAAVSREYKWLEIYGLKTVDMVVPPVTHRLQEFAELGKRHLAGRAILDEGSYLGLLGIAALVALCLAAVAAVVRKRYETFPVEAWLVFWVLAFFTTGGLNLVAGLFGLTVFRTGCRFSIVILLLALMYAARRLTGWRADKGAQAVAFLVFCAVVVIDQVPRAPDADAKAAIARQVESDRKFVEDIEAALPAGALVFQIPMMEYPEAPLPGMPSYDHLRPYLYSTDLGFSFGQIKGRELSEFHQSLSGKSVQEAFSMVLNRGYQAVYINRNGFDDKGAALIDEFRKFDGFRIIESKAGDLACVLLAQAPK